MPVMQNCEIMRSMAFGFLRGRVRCYNASPSPLLRIELLYYFLDMKNIHTVYFLLIQEKIVLFFSTVILKPY